MEQQILATLSLHAKTMVVTCWLETLANKDDLTNWSFTVVYDHRNVLQTLWLQRGYRCLETRSSKWDGWRSVLE